MIKKATYCKCKNTYTISKCDKRNCKENPYWKQGIGNIGGKVSRE